MKLSGVLHYSFIVLAVELLFHPHIFNGLKHIGHLPFCIFMEPLSVN